MNAILERAKAHYEAQERRRVEVPEWGEGGKPLVVTFSALTVAERRRIFRADRSGNAPDGHLAAVRAVIFKACDTAGKPLFSELDEKTLLHDVASGPLGRLAQEILAEGEAPEGLDSEKNV